MKKIIVICLAIIMALGCSACMEKKNPGLSYNEFSTDYDPNVDSWKQIDENDEDVEITWFMNFNWGNTNIEDLIYKRTGVKVNIQSAMTSDNTELLTMMTNNGARLPDIVTLSDLNLRVTLAEDGYCYAIDELARKYAPSLLKRIPQDEINYYKASDGLSYCLASNYHSDEDLEELDKVGSHLFMNYNIAIREDYLNAYLEYKKADTNFVADRDLTKPAGFLDMCKWIKGRYNLGASNPTVMLSTFPKVATNDDISNSLSCLMEMFCVPWEDENGDLVYQYDTEEFKEVINFLNNLYNENLIASSNFSADSAWLGTQLLNGRPAVVIGATQNLVNYIGTYMRKGYNAETGKVNPSNNYVGIVLTNSKGDSPLLCDYAGRGYRVSMITKNCKRPDRVIKVFDYLMSEQGQRELYYGEVEGEYYNFTVKPGETDPNTGKISKYGVIEWTEKAKNLLGDTNANLTNAGIKRPTMLTNYPYMSLTSSQNYQICDTLGTWIDYQTKCVYFDYTFRRTPFRYPLDVSNRKALNKYSQQQASIEALWIESLPSMIMAKNNNEAMKIYRDTLALTYNAGVESWLSFRNKCFKDYKQELGIEYAWPKADPNYTNRDVKLFGSFEKYNMEMPSWIKMAS